MNDLLLYAAYFCFLMVAASGVLILLALRKNMRDATGQPDDRRAGKIRLLRRWGFLLIAICCLPLEMGCRLLGSAVPTTEIHGEIAGQKFSLANPKNTVITNLTVIVATNGTATLSIGYLRSENNSNVIDAAYAGQAALATAIGQQIASGFQAGAAAAGAVAGAAVKTP
jgi:hypothetical protein